MEPGATRIDRQSASCLRAIIRDFCLITLVVFCFRGSGDATTVIVAVTPAGMIVGADCKTSYGGKGLGTMNKVVLLKKRLVVGAINAELVKSPSTRATVYYFPSWIEELDKRTNSTVSVSGLTKIIKDQMRDTFSLVIDLIQEGTYTKDNAIIEGGYDALIVKYVIAGYEDGVPVSYSLSLTPDWDARAVKGPLEVRFKEPEGARADSYFRVWGQRKGIDMALVSDTKERKELLAKLPTEANILHDKRDLTLNQASNVVRVLLEIQAETTPELVGLPFTIVTIPKTGKAWSTTYYTDFSSVSNQVKTEIGKQRKQP